MNIKTFIKKAIEGGWVPNKNIPFADIEGYAGFYKEGTLLDPLAWQAVGNVEGWDDVIAYIHKPMLYSRYYPNPDGDGDTEWRSNGLYGRVSIEEKRHLEEEAKKLKEGQNGYNPIFVPILKTKGYRDFMHRFIDALCDGKDLEVALDEATNVTPPHNRGEKPFIQ